MRLSEAFRRRVTGAHGEAGAAWLEALPELLADCHRTWGLRAGDGRFALSYAYVEPVVRGDGTRAVLKLAPPDDGGIAREAAALALYDGRGAVRLLADDAARGALLLERLVPGDALVDAAADDDAATHVLAGLVRDLPRPVPAGHPFPDVGAWGRALDEPCPAVPSAVLRRARDEYAELCASAAAPVLLHGDLHHFNVLRAGDGWRAIDPKGVVGEPAYETGALLRNPIGVRLPRARQERRIALLAEALSLDAGRMRAWARAQAVLCAVWAVQDGEDPAFWLACAEGLA